MDTAEEYTSYAAAAVVADGYVISAADSRSISIDDADASTYEFYDVTVYSGAITNIDEDGARYAGLEG